MGQAKGRRSPVSVALNDGSGKRPRLPLALFVGEPASGKQLRELLDAGILVVLAASLEVAEEFGFLPILQTHKEPVKKYKEEQKLIEVGNLTIDTRRHLASCEASELLLTEQEFLLLVALASPPQEALSYGELSLRVWNSPDFGGHHQIHSAVKRLRHKLDAAGGSLNIEAVRGYGFRLSPG